MSHATSLMQEDAFQDVPTIDPGRYQTLARLGQGGMADVLLAMATGPAGFNKLVVIKRLRPELGDTPAQHQMFRDMFLDEARLAARMSHPNVVQTYEVTSEGAEFFMTMEYLAGQPLSRLLSRANRLNERLDVSFAVHVAAEMLAGLHYAHELRDYEGQPLSVVHRDVSPQNIFITYEGEVKVFDFGIAKAEASNTKTEPGTVKGKFAYMAPEQVVADAVDRRADIFSAGIVLWEMLAGCHLMQDATPAKTLFKVIKEPIPRVIDVVPSIDPELDDIVMRGLERPVDTRWQTAQAMRDALLRWQEKRGRSILKEQIAQYMEAHYGDERRRTATRIREHMRSFGSQTSMRAAMPTEGFDLTNLRTAGSFPPSGVRMQTPSIVTHMGSSQVPLPISVTFLPKGSTRPSPLSRLRWYHALPLLALPVAFVSLRTSPPAPATPPVVIAEPARAPQSDPKPALAAPPSQDSVESVRTGTARESERPTHNDAPRPTPREQDAPRAAPRVPPAPRAPAHVAPPPPSSPAPSASVETLPAPSARPAPPPSATSAPSPQPTGRRIRTDL